MECDSSLFYGLIPVFGLGCTFMGFLMALHACSVKPAPPTPEFELELEEDDLEENMGDGWVTVRRGGVIVGGFYKDE